MSIESLVSSKLKMPRLILDILMVKYLIAARKGETETFLDVPVKYRQQLAMVFSKLNHKLDDVVLNIEPLYRQYVNGRPNNKVRCRITWTRNPVVDSV